MPSSDHSKCKYTKEAPGIIGGEGEVNGHKDDHIQKGRYYSCSRVEVSQIVLLEPGISRKQKNKKHQTYQYLEAYKFWYDSLPLGIKPGDLQEQLGEPCGYLEEDE